MVGFGYVRPSRSSSPRAQNEEAPPGCLLMVAIPILFLISTYFSWKEFQYALYSRRAEARVERTFETVDGSRRERKKLQINYAFEDASTGATRNESDLIPLHWERPVRAVDIAYLPSVPGASRVRENRSYIAPLFFAGCLIAGGIALAFLYREARMAEQEAARNERRDKRHDRGF
jgi:hypothetical protein